MVSAIFALEANNSSSSSRAEKQLSRILIELFFELFPQNSKNQLAGKLLTTKFSFSHINPLTLSQLPTFTHIHSDRQNYTGR